MSVQTQSVSPDNGQSPFPESIYIARFDLAALNILGANTNSKVVLKTLNPAEFITNVTCYVKEKPDGAGISGFFASIGMRNDTDEYYNSNFFTNGLATGNFFSDSIANSLLDFDTLIAVPSAPSGSTFSKTAVTTGGVAGTPTVITSNGTISATDFKPIGGIAGESSLQTDDFLAVNNNNELIADLTVAGINFNALTAGDIVFYIWTKQIPGIFLFNS